jgi:hypothetical protein
MDNAGIRLLGFGGRRNVDEVNHRLALAVEPRARKREIWSIPVRQTENLLVKPYRLGKFAGPDIEMIEHPNAHARAPLSGPEMMSYSTLTRFESRWNSFVTIPVASELLQAFRPLPLRSQELC